MRPDLPTLVPSHHGFIIRGGDPSKPHLMTLRSAMTTPFAPAAQCGRVTRAAVVVNATTSPGSGSRRGNGGPEDPDRRIARYVQQEFEIRHVNGLVDAFHVDYTAPKDTFSKRGLNSPETAKPLLELHEAPVLITAVRHVHVGTARPVHEGLPPSPSAETYFANT